jgi:glucose-1-phosphate thymidylyltransferase
MKGIILAGGTGSRLWPVTHVVSKQLLPLYDKPLIYYPLGTLMSAGIREVCIVTTPHDAPLFKNLLGDGGRIGMHIDYVLQHAPLGLAHGLLLCSDFVKDDSVALILGDNVFHGVGLGSRLIELTSPIGATIFAYRVSNPGDYGVIEFNGDGLAISVEEKPEYPRSSYAIPGLYFYDNSVFEIARGVRPSHRGEFEITSVNEEYLTQGRLRVEKLTRGTAWLDTGSSASLHDASTYMRIVEDRQGLKICCIEELAWRNHWIDDHQLKALATSYGNSNYGLYLHSLFDS